MSWMGIDPKAVGATYTSKGMIFVVVSIVEDDWGAPMAMALVLQDHPQFTKFIPPGTVMEIPSYTSTWREAMQIASLPEQGKVDP